MDGGWRTDAQRGRVRLVAPGRCMRTNFVTQDGGVPFFRSLFHSHGGRRGDGRMEGVWSVGVAPGAESKKQKQGRLDREICQWEENARDLGRIDRRPLFVPHGCCRGWVPHCTLRAQGKSQRTAHCIWGVQVDRRGHPPRVICAREAFRIWFVSDCQNGNEEHLTERSCLIPHSPQTVGWRQVPPSGAPSFPSRSLLPEGDLGAPIGRLEKVAAHGLRSVPIRASLHFRARRASPPRQAIITHPVTRQASIRPPFHRSSTTHVGISQSARPIALSERTPCPPASPVTNASPRCQPLPLPSCRSRRPAMQRTQRNATQRNATQRNATQRRLHLG
jgi:hypothetical protein